MLNQKGCAVEIFLGVWNVRSLNIKIPYYWSSKLCRMAKWLGGRSMSFCTDCQSLMFASKQKIWSSWLTANVREKEYREKNSCRAVRCRSSGDKSVQHWCYIFTTFSENIFTTSSILNIVAFFQIKITNPINFHSIYSKFNEHLQDIIKWNCRKATKVYFKWYLLQQGKQKTILVEVMLRSNKSINLYINEKFTSCRSSGEKSCRINVPMTRCDLLL